MGKTPFGIALEGLMASRGVGSLAELCTRAQQLGYTVDARSLSEAVYGSSERWPTTGTVQGIVAALNMNKQEQERFMLGLIRWGKELTERRDPPSD